MYPRIYLRHDQTIECLDGRYNDNHVVVVAPDWVKEALGHLSRSIPPGTVFDVYSNDLKVKSVKIEGELTLKDLVMIGRNEPRNTSGLIAYTNYLPLLPQEQRNVIHALRDLVRHCVIVARDETTHYGGYPRSVPVEQKEPVYVADLAGLQFQTKYNSGRLVLIEKNPIQGLLNDFIFEKVVKEEKKSVEEAAKDKSGRFVKSGDIFFDTIAYKRFVAEDVFITGLALNAIATEGLNFKFLKYGTGFFAGKYSAILNQLIYDGVADGLDKLLSSTEQKWIKHVEMPFYNSNNSITRVCEKYGMTCSFSCNDALKKTHPLYTTATTNCADPHAITGNEMGYTSVDAAIADNLRSKGNIFSPILNQSMRMMFINTL